MSGPWEKYQAGPWEKYQAKPEQPAPQTERGNMGYPSAGEFIANAARSSLPGAALQGIADVWDAGAQMLSRLGGQGEAEKVDAMVKERGKSYADSRAAMGKSGIDVGRALGPVMLTAGLPVSAPASTFLGRTAQAASIGGASGLMQPVTEDGDFWTQKGKQGALGATVGAVAAPMASGVAKGIEGATRPAVKALRDVGITPTPGQIIGGVGKSIEDRLTSFPVIGDAINVGRKRALDEFNRSLYTRVLEPLGPEAVKVAKSAPVGNEGIARVGDFLSKSYEDALQKSAPSVVDKQFVGGMNNLASLVPQAMQSDFKRIIASQIGSKVTPAGTLTPYAAKEAESELGRLAASYKSSGVASERELSRALFQAQRELRDMVARSNPATAPVIQKINAGWANLTQLETAGGRIGAKEGVVTPAQFLSAVKASDKSVRDRAFSRGQVRNQDLAQAADSTLSSKYPDSGTAGRLMLGGGLAYMSPELAIGSATASLGYTPQGQRALAALLSSRPQGAGLLANAVRDSTPLLGVGAAPLVMLP